jgi:OmpA-OmpF porin, OOP family
MKPGAGIQGCVATALLLAAATTANARPEGAGFYIGASGGQAKYDQDRSDFDSIVFDAFSSNGVPVLSLRSDFDDADNTFAVFAGYRFNRYVAVEGGYVDLGELVYTANATVLGGGPTPADIRVTVGAKGPLVSGMGIWPINDVWEVYGRAGLVVSSTDVKVTIRLFNFSDTVPESKTSVDSMIGLGTAVHFGDRVSLRLEYQRFGAVGDEDTTGETNIDLINLGVVARF